MTNKTMQFAGLMHGGDYNPEQWLDQPEILAEDIRLMKEANINCVTLGVFAWSVYEPHEGEYRFNWLLAIMNNLWAAGIHVILATPTAARPAWLDLNYTETMRVNEYGQRNHHGIRHNHCMSSPVFRQKAAEISRRLATAVKDHPALRLWHISNEYGGECFCPHCVNRFRLWLKAQYGNIEALNHAWWTTFWSHRFTSFDQVEPPYKNGEQSVPGLKLDWMRFTTFITTDCMQGEIDVVRAVTPQIPVTTNFMTFYGGLDYHAMAKQLDIISWDGYPAWHTDTATPAEVAADAAFDHAVIRGCANGRPFLLMESAPGLVNWHDYNKLKRPGMHRAASLQAVACGADSVQYFQWRKGRGSFEQYHGAVVDHAGGAGHRVFCEVAQVGQLLAGLDEVAGSEVFAEAAFVYDWDNRWAVEGIVGLSKHSLQYEQTLRGLYRIFTKHGIGPDVIAQDADFGGYKLLVLPMHYLIKPGFAQRLTAFVKNGGRVLATYLLGYVDATTLCWLGGFPGDGLKQLFGVTATEIDTLYPTDRNSAITVDGQRHEIHDYCELLQTTEPDTEVLARYGSDFYEGQPVVTRRRHGSGSAWYLGARLDETGTEALLKIIWADCGLQPVTLPEGVEHHLRKKQGMEYHFYLNMTGQSKTFAPVQGGTALAGPALQNGQLSLAPYEVSVQKRGE